MDAITYQKAFGEPGIIEIIMLFSILIPIIGSIVVVPVYRNFLKNSFFKSLGLSILCLVLAVWFNTHYLANHLILMPFFKDWTLNPFFSVTRCITPGFFVLFFIPFLLFFYKKWFLNEITEEERKLDMDGVRAWLRPMNLFFSIGLSFCYWKTFAPDESRDVFVLIFALPILMLLAYPIGMNLAKRKSELTNKDEKENHSLVQKKILDLLESGKINPHECVELIGAVSKTKQKKVNLNDETQASEQEAAAPMPPEPPTPPPVENTVSDEPNPT